MTKKLFVGVQHLETNNSAAYYNRRKKTKQTKLCIKLHLYFKWAAQTNNNQNY